MSMVLKNNMEAVRTMNILSENSNNLEKSLSKISCGMKIVGANDDPANWGISERMRVRIRALEQANQNAQNDASLMHTAEGAVDNTIDVLRTLKAKAIDAANDSNTNEDRQTIQKEINQLVDQIDDNALVTFNGKYLLTGSSTTGVQRTSDRNTWSRTIFLNQSLGTEVTVGSRITDLTNRAGDSLGIQSSDFWQVSWVKNGKVSVESGQISQLGGRTLTYLLLANGAANVDFDKGNVLADGRLAACYDKYGQPLYSPDLQAGVYIRATDEGIAGAITGYIINITDAAGNARKAANAALNGFKLLKAAENNFGNVGVSNLLNFQIGADANVAIKIGFSDMRSEALGLKGNTGNIVSVTTKDYANAVISVFENALTIALDQQTQIGATLSRLEYTSTNILTSRDNDQSAESVIRDADMAKEMTNYTKNNVLLQTAQSMLAQANQNSSAVLSLLQ